MATQMPSSLEIAQEATLRPVSEIAEELGLEPDEYDLYGKYKAKVDLSVVERLADRPRREARLRDGAYSDEGGRGEDDDVRLADAGARADVMLVALASARPHRPRFGSRAAR